MSGLLIPDVQACGEYARYPRGSGPSFELADGQFDQAAYTLQTGMQLGRHVAEAPTLIQAPGRGGHLGGHAHRGRRVDRHARISQSVLGTSGLPQPYIDLRRPLQGERMMMDNLLPGYREALADPARCRRWSVGGIA